MFIIHGNDELSKMSISLNPSINLQNIEIYTLAQKDNVFYRYSHVGHYIKVLKSFQDAFIGEYKCGVSKKKTYNTIYMQGKE